MGAMLRFIFAGSRSVVLLAEAGIRGQSRWRRLLARNELWARYHSMTRARGWL